jgi:energy-coupling factor transporter ATP-binding protein EcfA2
MSKRLQSMRVEKFRCFDDATIEIAEHGLSFIVGQNNTGKTMLTTALQSIAPRTPGAPRIVPAGSLRFGYRLESAQPVAIGNGDNLVLLSITGYGLDLIGIRHFALVDRADAESSRALTQLSSAGLEFQVDSMGHAWLRLAVNESGRDVVCVLEAGRSFRDLGSDPLD